MLQKIHERIQGVVAWIIIGLVGVTFTLLGIDYYLQFREDSSAQVEVNGRAITKQAFDLNYRRIRQMRDLSQMSPTAENQLKQQVLDAMIVNDVSVQSARGNGFEVNPDQANGAILHIPQFQQDGHFSTARYEQALNGAMFTPQSFQKEVRQGMLLNQQRFAFIGTAFALPNEIKKFVKLYTQTRDYDYLQISADPFLKQVVVADDEVATYYKQHEKEFLSAEKVTIDYVLLSMKDIRKSIKITDDQVQRYYEDNQVQSAITKPLSEVKADIQQQLLADLAQTQYSRMLEQLTDLSYQTPESLAPVAKALKLTITSSEPFSRFGGEGSVEKNKAVIDAAFSNDVLALGNNSEPIQLNNETMLVLRVNKRIPASQKTLAEVKPLIVAQLTRKKAEFDAGQFGKKLLALKNNSKAQEALMSEYALQWHSVAKATRDTDLAPTSINEYAFGLMAGSEAGEQFDGRDFVIVKLKKIATGKMDDLDKEQLASITQQIEASYGVLDYDLYVNELMTRAKIVKH